MEWNDPILIKALTEGKVVVMPTDTIYGLVGKAADAATVGRIYKIRKRAPEKPCIILIGDLAELEKFSVKLSKEQKDKLKEYWSVSPNLEEFGPTSVILDCPAEELEYLHRGTKTLAFRIPGSVELRNLLIKTGPLVVPSANPEGLPPAKNAEEAKNYFGGQVDLYIDKGEIENLPSRIVKLHKDGTISIIRK